MKNVLLLGALGAALMLSACETDGISDNDRFQSSDFGSSVHANIARQTVNPAAGTNAPVEANGERAGLAQQRYLRDRVTPPVSQGTSNVGGGNSGGGSGASTGSSGP